MTDKFRLDNDADNNASSNGNVYVTAGDKCLHIEYSADYSECGERNEYWGGQLAVEGSSWIEVNSVTDLRIVEVFSINTDDDEYLPLDYVMTDDDQLQIKKIITDFIEGNIEAPQPANSYYAA